MFALADFANPPAGRRLGHGARAAPAVRLSRAGDAFVTNMHHDEFGDYQMRNEVVEYEAGRRLAWSRPGWQLLRKSRKPSAARPGTGGGTSSPRRPWCHPGHRDVPTAAVPRRTAHGRPGRRGVAGRHDRVAGQAGTPGQGRRPAQPVGRRATSSPFTRHTAPDRRRGRRRAGAVGGSNAPAWVRACPGRADRRLPDHLRPGPFTYPEQPTMRTAKAVSSGPVARPERRLRVRGQVEPSLTEGEVGGNRSLRIIDWTGP